MAKDTRTRLIETTARLLQHRGYYGASLSDILEASGAPRGSLYFHFPGGKDQLVLEATRAAVAETTDALRQSLAAAKHPPEGVRLFIEAAADLMRESDYTFGCPVAPVILDATGGQSDLAELCRKAFEDWVSILQASFVAAGIPTARARALALLVCAAIEGLLLFARAYRDCGPLTTVAAELERAVARAMPNRRGKPIQ
jgi:TetR/AcrR family transcriptional regulator, lmrAB and yxaGH operons repressor